MKCKLLYCLRIYFKKPAIPMLNQMLRLSLLAFALAFFGCREDDSEPPVVDNSVNFDLDEVPYDKLSDYNFFKGGLAQLEPNDDVLPYDIISPLFSDYAKKQRLVWMPENESATYDGDGRILDFPNGAVLIKTFYYNHVQPNDERKILETRVLFKRNDMWEVAEYHWNEDQTDAEFDLSGKNVPLEWMNDNGELQEVNFRIPSQAECTTCHKTGDMTIPIGPKPQNMNHDYDYDGQVMNQLDKWKEVGYLSGDVPSDILTVVDWEDETQDLEVRVRSYLDINCAHCHQEGGHCDYRPIRLAFAESADPVNQGICITPQEFISENPALSHIIARGNVERSNMYYRLEATSESVRMPLMGRTVQHVEGLELMYEYINSLSPPCD